MAVAAASKVKKKKPLYLTRGSIEVRD